MDLVIGPKGIRQRTKADSTVSNFTLYFQSSLYSFFSCHFSISKCCFKFLLVYSPQAVCLAEFRQIRSIKYNTQSDGRTLLFIEIEGAKQVRMFSLQYKVVTLYMHSATLVVN